MNIEAMIKAKQAEMLALKEEVANGDSKAIEHAKSLKSEIDELKAKKAKADEANELLKHMGGLEEEQPKVEHTEAAKSLGEHVAKHIKGFKRGTQNAMTVPAFAKSETVQTNAPARANYLTNYKDEIDGIRRELGVLSLFGQENITNGNSVTYFVEQPVNGKYEGVAENGKYPKVSFGQPIEKTIPLRKIGAIYQETDELLEDDKRLADNINGRALYELDLEVESQLVNGTGNAGLDGLLNTEGMQVLQMQPGDDIKDVIYKAKQLVKAGGGCTADSILMSMDVAQKLRLDKDSNGHYFAGSAYAGQADVKPWGLVPAETAELDEKTFIVGAFKQAATVYTKGGTVVDVSNTNGEDFEYGRISIRPTRRLNLGVRRPSAFVKVTLPEA